MSAALKTADLPDEALSFIRGGQPRGEAPTVPEGRSAERGEGANPAPVVTAKPSRTQAAPMPVLVGLSTRIAANLHESLMRASFERKLGRQEPHTHQDIVTEALSAWLKKNGYPVAP